MGALLLGITVASVMSLVSLLIARFILVDTTICPHNPDLKGKVAVVTGTTSGIGRETARRLASLGATVVLADRDSARSEKVAQEISLETGNPSVEHVHCELSDLLSVAECAEKISRKYPEIHFLVNNAGVMGPPLTPSKQGYELQYAVNHLGHFLLTLNLLSNIIQGHGRIVNVSSLAHIWPHEFEFDTVLVKNQPLETFDSRMGKHSCYGRSKLANIYVASELQRRFGPSGISAFSLHPGNINTNLGRYFHPLILFFGAPFFVILQKTVVQGAQTSLTCCLTPLDELVPGGYYDDCHIQVPSELARDENVARKVWDTSVEQLREFLTPKAKALVFPASN